MSGSTSSTLRRRGGARRLGGLRAGALLPDGRDRFLDQLLQHRLIDVVQPLDVQAAQPCPV
jgi:hypothetical protein